MRTLLPFLVAAALALGGAPAALAHGDPAAHARESAKKPGSARVSVPDKALVDQDGKPRNLKREVVGGRIVVMDFVFTTCTTVCPVVSATFADLQKRLGDSLGREVALVSITLDPARDTPAVLKAYGAKHGAREGWLWLTGAPPEVTGVLKDFGAYVPDPSQHPSMILVGDGRTGQWTRFFGFPSADQLMAKVEELRQARAAPAAGARGNG
jgi:protein SCO1/2